MRQEAEESGPVHEIPPSLAPEFRHSPSGRVRDDLLANPKSSVLSFTAQAGASRHLRTENPAQTGGGTVTDLTEHQPQTQVADAQHAIQAEIRVVGDH